MSDPEYASDSALLDVQAELRRPRRQVALASLGAASCVIVAAASWQGLVPLPSRGSRPAQTARSSSLHALTAASVTKRSALGANATQAHSSELRRAQDKIFELRKEGVTCSNFRKIAMEPHPATEASEAACAQRCAGHPGCVGFGFQAHACFQEGGGNWQGACRLWSGECEDAENECWTDYSMTEPTKLDFELAKEHTGCSNWKSIAIGEKLTLPNAEACAAKCARAGGCTGFGYQPRTCDAAEQKSFDRQACYLFSGDCDYGEGPCWGYYTVSPAATPSAAPATTAPTPASATPPPTAEPEGNVDGEALTVQPDTSSAALSSTSANVDAEAPTVQPAVAESSMAAKAASTQQPTMSAQVGAAAAEANADAESDYNKHLMEIAGAKNGAK